MQPSPYTPGEVARDVPGRAVQVAQADERLAYLVDLQRLVGRVRVDVAARGIGKTSLLREIQRRADARGALTVWVTAGEEAGLIGALAEEIARRTEQWRSETLARLREALGRLTFTVGVPGVASVEARFGRDEPPPTRGVREFEAVVRQTVEAAHKEDRTGLVLFVDEIQAADPAGLRTLAYAWQHLQSEGQDVPAAVFAAGLPNAPEVIASVVTFSERFAYRPLQRLDEDATMVALAGPSRALGVWWDNEALAAALTEVQGYPYSVQLLGDSTWAAAGYPDRGAVLTLAHVEAGLVQMRADLDALFRVRWEKSTPAEQQFMQAMAAHGDGPVRRGDIAARLGVETEQISVPRARLLDKGMVEVAGRGRLDFSIPGFAQWVRERDAHPAG